MLSLPPEAPMATRSPRVKRWWVVIVWWISVSKTVRKQSLQSFWWFFGRRIRARLIPQSAQREGAIVGGEGRKGYCRNRVEERRELGEAKFETRPPELIPRSNPKSCFSLVMVSSFFSTPRLEFTHLLRNQCR